MRRLEFNVLTHFCVSTWEPGDLPKEQAWPSAPARSLQCLVKEPFWARQRQQNSLCTPAAKTFFKVKKDCIWFSFQCKSAPHNAEHNQRLIRDRGILTQVHLCHTSAKNDTFTILYQMKLHLWNHKSSAVGPSLGYIIFQAQLTENLILSRTRYSLLWPPSLGPARYHHFIKDTDVDVIKISLHFSV